MNLKYNMQSAAVAGELRHPQVVMGALGITYIVATPQSINDMWWFWGCSNVPEELPVYLTNLGLKPENAIGLGLSVHDAAVIIEEEEG